jgi:hypothetical protein
MRRERIGLAASVAAPQRSVSACLVAHAEQASQLDATSPGADKTTAFPTDRVGKLGA